jgi:hypothetical protein
MKSHILIILTLTYLALYSCKKDIPTETYQRGGNSMIETPDGNLLIAGYNRASETGFDGYLAKVSKEGEKLWAYNYGDVNTDGFYYVINATGGGYVATGVQSLSAYGISNLYMVKVNEMGEKVWQFVGDGIKTTQGFGITETPDNGFIACGYIQDSVDSDRDIYLVKVNSLGDKVWEKRYGSKKAGSSTGDYDEAYAITAAGDSGYYLTGSFNGNVSCCGKSFLMKISASGDSLWTKTYTQALGYSIMRLANGNIVICGSSSANGQDAYLIKTDASGEMIWEKSYGTAGYDFGTAVVLTQDGGYALTGFSSKSGSSNQDVSLYKVNESGALVWSKTFGGDELEQGYGLIRNSDGGFCISGLSNTGGSYIFFNRTDSDGVEIWQKNFN